MEFQVENFRALDSFFVSDESKHTIAFDLCLYFKLVFFVAAVKVVLYLGANPVTYNEGSYWNVNKPNSGTLGEWLSDRLIQVKKKFA